MSEHYAGRLRASLSRPGLELAETTYTGGQAVDRHVHERPLVILVVSGVMRELVGKDADDCRAGSGLFHPAGEAHAHRFGDRGARCLVLQFGGRWIDRLVGEGDLLPEHPTRGLNETVTGAGRLLHREFRRGEAADQATLDGLALTLLGALGRRDAPSHEARPDFLAPVLERIHDDVATDASLSSLADLAGVTPEHLARTFRREQGCTLGAYVRRIRVRRARRALVEDDIPLSRLALELGFYDQPHFTRVFKAHVGCPPGEYRRRRKGSEG